MVPVVITYTVYGTLDMHNCTYAQLAEALFQ